ncbi:MAG: AAA family ATPase [Ramlibacter sp.]
MFLKSIEISNVRSIDNIELDFRLDGNKVRQRTVMLGENGCGKSTALRAIALLLAGSDALTELLREPERWVRNGRKQARIAATLGTQRDGDRAIELLLEPGWTLRQTLKENEAGLAALDQALAHTPRNYFAMGYGVTRRPAMDSKEFSQVSERGFAHPRSRAFATMFSPEASLVSLEQWAMDLDYREGTAATAVLRAAMSKLLPGMTFHAIDRKRRELLFKTVDGMVPFRQLSDGYQNIANWCGDMLYRITTTFEDYKSPLKTRGVLLIDELDLHLHPVWQRRLMDFLQSALPNLQIIATSHSPIIAQQLREGELYVVERPTPRKGSCVRPVAGDPSQLTLTQLLSPMFGIESPESLRVQTLREKSRIGQLSDQGRSELAQLAPLDELPKAMRQQVKAAEELKLALAQASGNALPKLDTAQLRKRIGEQIKLSGRNA